MPAVVCLNYEEYRTGRNMPHKRQLGICLGGSMKKTLIFYKPEYADLKPKAERLHIRICCHLSILENKEKYQNE